MGRIPKAEKEKALLGLKNTEGNFSNEINFKVLF